MNETLQTVLALLLVLAAAGFLVWRKLRARGRAAVCEDCPAASCANRGDASRYEPQLVSIGEPPRPDSKR